ncbi:MAG: vWA domain-containing protein [Spirochaetota bacterium]
MKKTGIVLLAVVVTLVFTSCDDLAESLGLFADVQEDFSEISDQTGGEQINAKGAEEVPDKILEIIEPAQGKVHSGSDVVFLIDKTGSMADDIDEVKESLSAILSSAPSETLFVIATYGDKNNDGDEWYSTSGNTPTDDTDSLQEYVDAIETTGGGDWPESVYDGLWKTMDEVEWQSVTQRIIILIGDASPLTDDKTDYSLDDVVEKSREETPNIQVFTIAIDN